MEKNIDLEKTNDTEKLDNAGEFMTCYNQLTGR